MRGASVSHVPISSVLRLEAVQAWDRWRLRRLAARHPGLEVHPSASSNFAAARYALAPGARLRIVDEQQINPMTIIPGFYRDPARANRVADDYWGKTFLSAQQIEDLVAYLVTLK